MAFSVRSRMTLIHNEDVSVMASMSCVKRLIYNSETEKLNTDCITLTIAGHATCQKISGSGTPESRVGRMSFGLCSSEGRICLCKTSYRLLTKPDIRGVDWLTWSQNEISIFFTVRGKREQRYLATAHKTHQQKILVIYWFHCDCCDLALECFIQMETEWLQSFAAACHLSHMPQIYNDFMLSELFILLKKKCVFPVIYY